MESAAAPTPEPRSGQRVAAALAAPGPAGWLFGGLVLLLGYAAFADGGTGVISGARVEVATAALLVASGVALAAGGLDGARSRAAWFGAALLAAYAAWTAAGVAWSVAPDQGWLAANRAVAYAAVVAVCLVIAPRIRAARVALAVAMVAVALAVALYALGGKIAPELSVGPVSLDHASQFARLREPLGYWNALGLLMVMAMPACVWLAASHRAHLGIRTVAVLALQILIVTAALTLSRGAVLAAVLGAAIMVAVGPERLGRLAAVAGATLFAVPPVAFAFTRETLSENGVAAAARADDGLLLGLCLAGSLVALAGAARIALRFDRRGGLEPPGRRRVWRGLALLALLSVVGAGMALQFGTERGLTGTIDRQWTEFRSVEPTSDDPGRLVSASSSNRWSWWREATGAFADKPVAGWGPGSFPVIHRLYRSDRGQVSSAHSVPLQVLAENGIVGAAILLGALLLLAAAAIGRLRRAGGGDHGARLALMAAFACWSFHSLYDWNLEIPGVTLPALAAIAFAASGTASRPRPSALRRDPAWRPAPAPLAAGAAVVASLAAAFALLPAMAERRLGDALALAASDDGVERALELSEKAERLNPLSDEALRFSASLRVRLGDLQGAEQELAEAVRRQPESADAWAKLSNAALALGNPAVAREALINALTFNPALARAVPAAIPASVWLVTVPPEFSPAATGTPAP